MSAQTLTRNLGQTIKFTALSTKDANGVAVQNPVYTLNVLSGSPTGLTFSVAGGTPQVLCAAVGTYQIQLTCTNAGGSLTTDAAGDTTIADTIIVIVPAPESQGWTYV